MEALAHLSIEVTPSTLDLLQQPERLQHLF
jgi:hypothetical protein